ncbi:3-phosphoshikimate 1-carboxyvinyltransferase [Exiguobacterium sp. SH3S2]|uniref:3-phosphoshikimate 1-carboxyvinyltransferase n=1 Tax=unclassified Exiguobacterium TaxID=2644629 RepID=UPI00103F3EA1|nr:MULTISPECIES: 3-phosphoshikimate 1-carboxyvinyltransferase [unclassified Exiguobacterium]TCI27361.1 3-phosphoshikimate 1-carboxyvinyltransferase [Exiguobacterium sp. SH5S4]TCI49317.1 3-phosphoshikimate 1-carboxyvinyltransferase [Exiguobacterium sp. SH3S3]TCI57891.1 3-phosphoshikimate 1-carboxyvinyltransferase [Exiguobacterium sp. SH5S13]TCI64630.1 3-phosphoshikimate 1-carboxyvinyltransferase [Exiguobacterium sp. SH3S2]TCI66044.1 3-phosphoshikimate 1-carboxyvinyltransferase [Exiguobacterium 
MGLNGLIRVPSDKSITHRAILFGAIASGETVVMNPLLGADCRSTIDAVRSLGASVEELDERLRIEGVASVVPATLDCGNSGTTMRLLSGLVSGYSGEFTLVGDDSLSKRPMRRITEPLRQMGADIDGEFAPVRIKGRRLSGIDYTLPVASAQVKSAVLLAGLRADGTTIVREPMLSRDHTERMLPLFGGRVEITNEDGVRTIRLSPSHLDGATVDVPADPSSAAFFWAGAAIVPNSRVTTTDVCLNETRIGFLRTLERMGANVEITRLRPLGEETVGDVTVTTSELQGVTLEGEAIPRQIDELPLFALVASQASSPSVVKDAGELRVKETDRIKTVASELAALGVDIRETEDGFSVFPSRLQAGHVSSHSDHRLSMMLQVAALLIDEPVIIDGIEASEISYPHFRDDLQRLGREIE